MNATSLRTRWRTHHLLIIRDVSLTFCVLQSPAIGSTGGKPRTALGKGGREARAVGVGMPGGGGKGGGRVGGFGHGGRGNSGGGWWAGALLLLLLLPPPRKQGAVVVAGSTCYHEHALGMHRKLHLAARAACGLLAYCTAIGFDPKRSGSK